RDGVKADAFHTKAQFSGPAFSLPETAPLEEIIKHFIESKYRRIPIVADDGKLIGIITRRDLMRLFFYRAKLG
ncbi:MAG TPA: CBS domain-containing protein, partial [Bdellovibrionota bacterium]|nr:CBS domain-containing protein [Bdellovibrionota bacterium]